MGNKVDSQLHDDDDDETSRLWFFWLVFNAGMCQ